MGIIMGFIKKVGSAPYLLLAVLTGLLSGCDAPPSEPATTMSEFIIGSYAKENEPGIYRLQLDGKTGALSSLTELAVTPNPSYLALSANQQSVFAVNETGNGGVSVFNWQTDKSALMLVSQLTELGENPCHISLSPDGTMLAIANYSSGDIGLFKIEGANSAEIKLREFARHQSQGQGPHARQEAAHMHWVNWSPDGKFIYSVDLGLDEVKVYELEGETLLPAKVAIKLQAGDGPRHMVFSLNHELAYITNELSNDVVVLKQDSTTGLLTEIQRLSTLPAEFAGKSQTAAIKLSPKQDFLYVSNRGLNSIAVYAVDAQGKLSYLQDQSTGGNWPRDFVISNDGEFLLVTNQLSNDITVLKRDNKNGLLSATEHKITVSQPTFISQL
jgi:6-phosphogluconolactonase